MSLKYRIALTVFLLEAAMMAAVIWQFERFSAEAIPDSLLASGAFAGAPDELLRHAMGMLRDRTLFIAMTGMSLIALAGLSIGFLLTRRLERLAGAAERLAAGESHVRVDFSGRDEVARLGRSFDAMSGEITSAMKALKSSEERNRVLVENCPAAIFVFDPEAFRLVDVNEKWVELLKYPRDKIVGMTPLQASPPLQRGGRPTDEWAQELVQRTFAGENPVAPWILRDSTGHDFPCELQLASYPEAGKNLIIGIIYDVSERDRLAEALNKRMQFEDLVVEMSARLISLKPDEIDQGLNEVLGEIGRFAGVDRSYMFEFGPDHSTESCTHEWCAPGIEPAIDRLQNLPLKNYPWFMQRIGRGEVLHVPQVSELLPEAAAERAEFEAENIQSVIMVPLVFEGQVSGYLGFDAVRRPVEWPPDIVVLLKIIGEIVFNALHRKRIETALREQAQALARVNTSLENSNEELKQFAYIASHDLREPLRAIAGFSALLAERYTKRLDKDADEYIKFITDAAHRMHNMINDLLNYSRLDTQDRTFAPVEMEQMLMLAQTNLLASISEHGAQITHDPLPVVKGDATLIVQLFQNLISNAIKFRSKTKPHIHVGVKQHDGEWLFSVRDNGIGIDPRHAEAVFRIFKRLHSNDEYEGTGIGLAICKRIVERHGGRIWVERNADVGSTFHFTIPAGA